MFSNVTALSVITGHPNYVEIKFIPDNILITKQIHTVISRDKNILELHVQLCTDREYNLHTMELNR